MIEPTGTDPALTVVLAGLADGSVLETTLLHLRAQTARERIELVIVTPSLSRLGPLPVALDAMHSCRVIEAPSVTSCATANAAGVRAASALVVALVEDHAFPDPNWAESLLAAHEGPWTAVGPAIVNANPASLAGWSDFVLGYGPWMEPAQAGPRPFLPGHNCSYKRAALLALGDELEEMLEAETVLHYRFAAQGNGLYLEPRARVAHLNVSRWPAALSSRFHSGRVYASALRTGWSTPRKATYAVASPLIPFVRFAHCLRQLREPGRRGLVPRAALPGLALSLVCDGAGQVAGHLAGAGNSVAVLSAYEFRRVDHITDADRRALEALTAGLRSADA